jgi:hypothetical protein
MHDATGASSRRLGPPERRLFQRLLYTPPTGRNLGRLESVVRSRDGLGVRFRKLRQILSAEGRSGRDATAPPASTPQWTILALPVAESRRNPSTPRRRRGYLKPQWIPLSKTASSGEPGPVQKRDGEGLPALLVSRPVSGCAEEPGAIPPLGGACRHHRPFGDFEDATLATA